MAVSWLVVTLTILFDITAFGLALGAMARRSQASAAFSAPGYLTCSYSRDVSTGLAAAACIFLIIGQVLISVVTKCLCCGATSYKQGAGRICAIILFVFSWISFVIAEIFLITGASENSLRTSGQVDVGTTTDNQIYCRQVRKSIFAIGAAFSFLTMLCSIIYYFLLAKSEVKGQPWQQNSYQDDPYTGNAPTVGMTAYN